MNTKHDYIAVFDSGVGGISVLRHLVKQMPGERYLYFGDSANAGDVLVVLEAMKMEIEVAAPCAGTVKAVAATVGSAVNTDDLLVTLG